MNACNKEATLLECTDATYLGVRAANYKLYSSTQPPLSFKEILYLTAAAAACHIQLPKDIVIRYIQDILPIVTVTIQQEVYYRSSSFVTPGSSCLLPIR